MILIAIAGQYTLRQSNIAEDPLCFSYRNTGGSKREVDFRGSLRLPACRNCQANWGQQFRAEVCLRDFFLHKPPIQSIGVWTNCSETRNFLAILCDLFGMAKQPFQRLSDLQADEKVTAWITWPWMICYFVIARNYPFENPKICLLFFPFAIYILLAGLRQFYPPQETSTTWRFYPPWI